jgi:uncharacterized protein
MNCRWAWLFGRIMLALLVSAGGVAAQVRPSASEVASFGGLHAAAAAGDLQGIKELMKEKPDLEAHDANGRTAFLVAAYMSKPAAMESLVAAGADANALDAQRYDAVTIAAVANDLATLKTALRLGNKATNITSPYDGTALIAAAHLGHDKVVSMLIAAGAPLDHINNLGWTALIEAVILGDGGASHIATVKALVEAGADRTIADRGGTTPLGHAKAHGYAEMIKLLSP